MITDSKNSVLLDKYQKACEDENDAIEALIDYLSLPSINKETIDQLSGQMEAAHSKSIALRSQLEAVRIDK